MRELRFFADDIAKRYGHPLYRIAMDAGFSCPHRAPDGHGGCVFCSASGSRAVHLHDGMSIEEQVRAGVKFVTERYQAEPPYMAYFQAFTATNAPAERLHSLLERTMALADFPVVILATRPDCLPDEILNVLSEWNRKRELWIELGVQTANDDTLRRIRRGHDFSCTASAVKRLAERGIRTAAHLIVGLPGETIQDNIETARKIAALPFSAVKIHNLLVLRGTELAKMYAAADSGVVPLNEYEYAERLGAVIGELPDNMLLMRLSAEAPDADILAPKWWMKKSQFADFFRAWFLAEPAGRRFLPVKTDDGSSTLYHPAYRQHFHSLAGAYEESVRKYLMPGQVETLLRTRKTVRVLDVGFGMGFNVSAAYALAERVGSGKLEITSMEADPDVLKAASTLPDYPAPDILKSLAESGRFAAPFTSVELKIGDARQTLPSLAGPFDRIFLDGFSPDTNPELWTIDFIALLKEKLAPAGMILAYSSAYPVIGAFLRLEFDLRLSEPFGRKRPGLAACLLDPPADLQKLNQKDRDIALKSTAGIPWRDPGLCGTRKQITNVKVQETARLRAEGMPKWVKNT